MEAAHDAFYKRHETWCLDAKGDTLGDQPVSFTGTYTPATLPTRSETYTNIPHTASTPLWPITLTKKSVPRYIYATHALENITTEDKTWSFTPSLLLYGEQDKLQEWINSHHYLLGKRAQDEPGQDPDTELIALNANDSRLATLDQERDLPTPLPPIPTDDSYRPPCISCLSYACNDCAVPPNQSTLSDIVVKASAISGYGVFSRVDMAPGTFICEYNGEIISAQATELRGLYNNAVGRSYFYDLGGRSIDACYIGNESRFINGSPDANCTAMTKHGRIYIHAAKWIRRGDELTLEYSLEGMPGHET